MTAILMLLGALMFVPLLITLNAIINGYVLSTLWGWFMVPIFGFVALSIPEAIGVSIIFSYFTYQHVINNRPKGKEEKKADAIEQWTIIIAQPILYLLIGYVVKSFM